MLADFRVQGLYFLGGTADTGGMEPNASPVIDRIRRVAHPFLNWTPATDSMDEQDLRECHDRLLSAILEIAGIAQEVRS